MTIFRKLPRNPRRTGGIPKKPSTLPHYVVVLSLRIYSIRWVLLEENFAGLPRTFVDKRDIWVDVEGHAMIKRIRKGANVRASSTVLSGKGALEGDRLISS